MSKHTPGPFEFKQGPHPYGYDLLTREATGDLMRRGGGLYIVGNAFREQDAEYIVRCVNAHEKLVEALRKVNTWLIAPDPHAFEEMYQVTLAALALAEK